MKKDFNSYKKILFLLTGYKKKVYYLFLSIILVNFIELLSIGLFVPVISRLTNNQSVSIFNFDLLNNISLIHLLAIILIIYFIKFIFLVFLNIFKENIVKNLVNKYSNNLLDIYLKQNYNFFLKNSSPFLIRNINSEVPGFCNRIILSIINFTKDTMLLIFILIFLFFFNFEISLVSSIFFIIFTFIFIFFSKKKVTQWGQDRLLPEKTKLQVLQDIFFGIREIKIYNIENTFLQKFNYHNYQVLSLMAKDRIISQLPRLFFEILVIFGLVCLILFLKKSYSINEVMLILGVYTICIFKILPSVSGIIVSVNSMKFGSSIIQLLFDEFSRPLQNATNKKFFFNKIKLENISYRYDGKDIVLKKINYSFEKKKIYGILGDSGSGKSTFLDIISGILNPSDGKIFLDSELKEKNTILENVSYVSQFNFILSDTIKNNIILNDKNLIDEFFFEECIKLSNLETFIASLEEKENTFIGEGYQNISGGERQRLAIARALYQKSDILLLDEFTSALDNKNEKEVLNTILNLKDKKLIIMVSHNKNVIDICDKKLFLENGKLNEVN